MKNKTSVLTSMILSSLPAFAGTAIPTIQPAPESPWSCRVAIYGWAESLKGEIGVLDHTAKVDLSFKDILKHFNMGFMGAVEVGYKRWSFLADSVYAEISGSDSRRNIYVHLDDKQYLGNFIVAYEVMRTDSMKFDVYGGARVNWIKSSLDISDHRRLDFHGSATESWVDPIIGARFQTELPSNFFFRTVGDVGGFGVSSQFTWQAMAGLGYSFHEHGNLLLGYRALGTNYTNGGFTYDLIAHGPVLGYEFRF